MGIDWAFITAALEKQRAFCDGYSLLYYAVCDWLAGVSQAHLDGETLSAGGAGFVAAWERECAGRNISSDVFASLLVLGAIHAAVLQDEAPALAPYYATHGGQFDPTADTVGLRAGLEALFDHGSTALNQFLREGDIQTNEVSRSAVWLIPALVFSRWQPDLTITLVDFGTSAGLNLAADLGYWAWDTPHGLYTLNAVDDTPPLVRQTAHFEDMRDPAWTDLFSGAALPPLRVVGRVGVDLNPLDIFDERAYLMLQACIWADQPERMERLARAREGYRQMLDSGIQPRRIQGDILQAGEHLAQFLPSDIQAPHLLLVYNSAVTVYFDDALYDRLRARVMHALANLPHGVVGLWLENESPRYNERGDRPGHFLMKARLPFMGGMSTVYLGESEAHPKNIYLRPGWDVLRELWGW